MSGSKMDSLSSVFLSSNWGIGLASWPIGLEVLIT